MPPPLLMPPTSTLLTTVAEGGWVGGDAVVNYVIAVCLEEGEESVVALEHIYEARKQWVHN